MTRNCFIAAIWMLLTQEGTIAATVPSGFVDATFVSGLGQSTAMDFSPDGRLFACEKAGSLRVIKNGVLLSTPFLTVPAFTGGESGLLGVAFDPDHQSNRFVYIYYTANTTPRRNRVSRFTAGSTDPDVAEPGSELVILGDIPSDSASGNHQGGAIHFGVDGMLYVAVGDDTASDRSQSLETLSGKLLRIDPASHPDIVPPDNPFVMSSGARGEIWALGLRNPFTFSIQSVTGKIHINDVGSSSVEEINLGGAGANYGWPICEGSCGNVGFQNPIHEYPHGNGAAVSGGAFYNSSQFPSDYYGDYFFADFVQGFIQRLKPDNSVLPFATNAASVVDLKVGPDGSLYYVTLNGTVHQVSYSDNKPWIVLDRLGGVHEATGKPTPYFGFEIAQDIELSTSGSYVLDGFGGIHAGGGASLLTPETPYFGFDIARDMELAGTGFFVLDGLGGLHAGGGAGEMSPAPPYFGFDAARDLELASTGLYVLDGFGGIHAGGGATVLTPATPYFGFDIARDLELGATGYYVLDGFGGVHPGGGATALSPSTPYFGFDIARDLELSDSGYYVLDGFGGVHAGGGAAGLSPAPPYFGFDVAKDLELK